MLRLFFPTLFDSLPDSFRLPDSSRLPDSCRLYSQTSVQASSKLSLGSRGKSLA